MHTEIGGFCNFPFSIEEKICFNNIVCVKGCKIHYSVIFVVYLLKQDYTFINVTHAACKYDIYPIDPLEAIDDRLMLWMGYAQCGNSHDIICT